MYKDREMNHKKIIIATSMYFAVNAMTEQEKIIQWQKNRCLMRAIYSNSPDEVKLALENGASPHRSHDQHPLKEVICIRNRLQYSTDARLEIIKLLLAHNVNTNEKDGYSFPPLFLAISMEDYEVAELLIDHGADMNYTRGNRSIWSMCIREKPSINFAKLLLDKGLNVDLVYTNEEATCQKFLIFDFLLVQLNFAQAVINFNAEIVKLEKFGSPFRANLGRNGEITRALDKSRVDEKLSDFEILKHIVPLLIAHGAPILRKELDHEFLKPMLRPYVDVVQAFTRLSNPLARLVVEYIYNIKVNLEDKGI